MKYSIDFTVEQLQFVIDVLTKTPLPWEKVNPLINYIQEQAKNQEDAYRNPITKLIEDSRESKKEESSAD